MVINVVGLSNRESEQMKWIVPDLVCETKEIRMQIQVGNEQFPALMQAKHMEESVPVRIDQAESVRESLHEQFKIL